MAEVVATIGMFDGVHWGHQFVLHQVVAMAHERGLQPMAITFDHSPRCEQVLTPLDEKLLLLSQTGIERVEVLPFTDELKRMTARQFMQQILKERYCVKVLLTGYDNRFGHNREEGFDDYVRYGRELGIEVRCLPPAPSRQKEDHVSSSYIRQLLTEGRVTEAVEALGHPYTLKGRVTHGEHVGTGLGYPTANILPDDPCQLLPATGVYAVTVRIEDSKEDRHAMMNIGHRPTFDGQRQTLEVHILQLHGDLYGQRLRVSFVCRLRDEQRFDGIDALKAQLQRDAAQAEAILSATQL